MPTPADGQRNADFLLHPTLLKEGDAWYIFGTGEGIRVKRSSDVYNWTDSGSLFDALPAWAQTCVPKHDGKITAPDIK